MPRVRFTRPYMGFRAGDVGIVPAVEVAQLRDRHGDNSPVVVIDDTPVPSPLPTPVGENRRMEESSVRDLPSDEELTE